MKFTIIFLVLSIPMFIIPAAFGQFTQGPPENPSAAGITMGTPPPAALPPRPVAPLPPTPSERAVAPTPYPVIIQEQDVLDELLRSEGIAPLLPASPGTSLLRRLNLSGDQMERLRDVRMRFHQETREIRYQLQQKRLEMQHLFADPQVSANRLEELHKEILFLDQKLRDAAGRAGIEARRALRPEQIELLETP